MSGITFLKQNPSKLGWDSPIRKMACCLSFLLWLALLQASLAVNVPAPNGTVVTQILSASSSNPEVKVVEDRDLGKILVYPPQPKEFTVKIIAKIMYLDDQYLEKISTVMVGGAGVTIESNEIRNSLILATLKVAPGASGGRFSITYENEDNPNHKGCNVRLLPVELISDLDNDGKITSTDHPLRDAALKAGASDIEKDKGTEFLFVDDDLSNGLWDKDDGNAPDGTEEDDDVQEIQVKIGIKTGIVEFDHPVIDWLNFYDSKKCDTELSFPFDLKQKNLPEKIYIRASKAAPWDGQSAGNLVIKYKSSSDSASVNAAKLKLTVVHQIGDAKYFNAVRDYILENEVVSLMLPVKFGFY